MSLKILLLFFSPVVLFCSLNSFAQNKTDTLPGQPFVKKEASTKPSKTDSLPGLIKKPIMPAGPEKPMTFQDSLNKRFNPRTAMLRSAIIPGWGQAYNKKYWKIPLVYATLGTTATIFVYNLNTYKQLRQAYIYRSDTIPSNDLLIPAKFQGLSKESLRTYRNSFRQNVDYSVLVFIVFWGLNVMDATVDAHLKAFDVSSDLSLRFKPGFSPMANTTGLSVVLSFKDSHTKVLSSSH